MPRVTLPQFRKTLTLGPRETILDAALGAGLDYPFGCQSGNCGSCKSTLLAGEVDLLPHSEFALSDEERANGRILACQAVPQTDCEVAYIDLDETVSHPRRETAAVVSRFDDATHDIRRVFLRLADGPPLEFSAGQYAALTFDDLPRRDFSMANQPLAPELEFHIRALPSGTVSQYVFAKLRPGDKVKFLGPLGVSYLRTNHAGPVVALAGGSGLAPIKSIVERALVLGFRQPIDFYFGVRAERDLYLEEHFRALAARHPNLRFIPVLSDPDGPTERRTGFVADALARDHSSLDGAKVYLAGPPIMVETCVAAALRLGARKEDCHADAFYTEAEKAGFGAA